MVDYPQAITYLVDASRVFVGENDHAALVIHGTGGSATQTAQQLGDYFRTTPLETSSHYGVDRAGIICQYVLERDGAGGNCCTEAGHDTFWDQFGGDNLNKHTLSIECENDTENSLTLSSAQQHALFPLIAHLCKKYSIAPDHIKSHASIAPVTRASCPGKNFPWSALWDYLKGVTSMTEVCSVTDTSQFSPNKSVEKCGFFSIALLKYAGHPGQAPSGNASEITAWADSEYVKYDGQDTSSNSSGMTVPMEYQVIQDAGLHYQGIGATETGFHVDHLTADYIRAWLKDGYPVLLAVAEDAVFDEDLGAKPYSWNTAGLYHIITATGYDGKVLLCHDTASIGTDGVRPGPRRYDAQRLQSGLISATAVVLPWLSRPASDFDPTQPTPHTQSALLGETPMDIKDPDFAARFFQQVTDGDWYCPTKRQHIIGDILKFYRKTWGAARLPLSAEMTDVAGIKWQHCEAGVIIFDPSHVHDHPAGDPCYLARLDDPMVQRLFAKQQIVITGNAGTALDALLANITLQKQTLEQVAGDLTALEHGTDAAAVTVANIKTALAAGK